MDIVCRLMCQEEFTKFLNGEVVENRNYRWLYSTDNFSY